MQLKYAEALPPWVNPYSRADDIVLLGTRDLGLPFGCMDELNTHSNVY